MISFHIFPHKKRIAYITCEYNKMTNKYIIYNSDNALQTSIHETSLKEYIESVGKYDYIYYIDNERK